MILDIIECEEKRTRAVEVADKLLRSDSRVEDFSTETREEYNLLFEAISEGWLPEHFSLGRSGMWLNKKRINPPDTVVNH